MPRYMTSPSGRASRRVIVSIVASAGRDRVLRPGGRRLVRRRRTVTSAELVPRGSGRSFTGYDLAMSEPLEAADNVEQIAPGVWHWSIQNSNIGGNTSASHALGDEDGSVWIDPVRVDDPDSLPRPQAIVLTSR